MALMIGSFFANSYISWFYSDKIIPPIKGDSNISENKKSRVVGYLVIFWNFLYSYSTLVFHSLLNMLIVFDKEKDLTIVLLFVTELIIVPMHLQVWIKQRGSIDFYRRQFYWFKIIFVLCLFHSLFRYFVFFFKYTIIQHQMERIFGEYMPSHFENQLKLIYLEVDMDQGTIKTSSHLLNHYLSELLIIVLSLFTFICLKHRVDQEIVAEENGDGEIFPEEFQLESQMNASHSIKPLSNPKIRLEDWSQSIDKKEWRTFLFLIYFMFVQGLTLIITTKALTERPSFGKALILSLFMLYIIRLFKKINRIFDRYRVFDKVFKQINYFEKSFVNEIKPPRRFKFDLTENMEKKEKLMDKLFWLKILAEFDEIARTEEMKHTHLLVLPSLIQNVLNIIIFVFFKFKGGFLSFIVSDKLIFICNIILGYQVTNTSELETDVVYSQILISFLLINFGIYRNFHKNTKKKIAEIPIELSDKISDCIDARIDVYSYSPPKLGISYLTQKSEKYIELFKASEEMINRYFEGKVDLTPNIEKKTLHDHDSDEGSNEEANILDSNDEFEEDETLKKKNRSMALDITLSERTVLKDKLIFIHHNRQKYYFSKCLMAMFFNISRIALAFVILNFILSKSLINIAVVVVCYLMSTKPIDIFLSKSPRVLSLFCIYFQINWVIFRNKALFDWGPYSTARKWLKQEDISPNIMALGSFVSYSFGYAAALGLTRFVFMDMFVIRQHFARIFYLNTADNYLVIDYEKWKKGPYAIIHLFHKLSHTSIVEIFATSMFLVSILMNSGGIFRNLITFLVFILASGESIKLIKVIGKSSLKVTNRTVHLTFMKLVLRFIDKLVWITYLICEFLEYFDYDYLPIPVSGLTCLYIVQTAWDLINSTGFHSMRKKLKEENALKISFASLCRSYRANDNKVFERISSFVGKSKLDKMSKSLIFSEKLEEIKVHLDYNYPHLKESLDDLYVELRKANLSGLQNLKQILIFNIYNFLDKNINYYRYLDIFALYQTVEERNREILDRLPLDLKFYFNGNYRQFESVLNNTSKFYKLFEERDRSKLDLFKQRTDEMLYNIRLNRDKRESYSQAILIKQIDHHPWEHSANRPTHLMTFNSGPKDERLLKECSNILFKLIDGSRRKRKGFILFNNLKVHLQKFGYVECKFGRIDIVLHNIYNDSVIKTQGFCIFNLRIILRMIMQTVGSNIEVIITIVMICMQTLDGGLFNIPFLGVLFFCILLEEHYGNSYWWGVAYLISLIRLVAKIGLKEFPQLSQLIAGRFGYTDILCIAMINLVLYVEKKIGIPDTHLIAIESPGAAIARLVINQDFERLAKRATKSKISKLTGFSLYLQSISSKKLTIENYHMLKTKCTRAIVKAYLLVEKFMIDSEISTLVISQRMMKDIFICTPQNCKNFFFRNYSKFSRKMGVDLKAYIYLLISAIIIYSTTILPKINTDKVNLYTIFVQGENIDTFTLANISFYIFLIVTEIYFYSFDNSHDSVGIRNDHIITEFYRRSIDEMKKQDITLEKRRLTPIEKFRERVTILVILIRFWKKEDHKKTQELSNPLFAKTYFLIFYWLHFHINSFFLQPYFAQRKDDFNRSNQDWTTSFLCDIYSSKFRCFAYQTNWRSQTFYMMNCVLIYIGIWQIRKGMPVGLPQKQDFSKLKNKLRYHIFYNVPAIREVRTLMKYIVTTTTLTISEWLLCDDIRKNVEKAGITHAQNSSKDVGVLIPKSSRSLASMLCLGFLYSLTVIPLVIFSDIAFTSSGYEIDSGSLKMEIYVEKSKKLVELFDAQMLLENRELSPLEIEMLESYPEIKTYDLKMFRVVSFSSFSEGYLSLERNNIDYIYNIMKAANDVEVRIRLSLRVIYL